MFCIKELYLHGVIGMANIPLIEVLKRQAIVTFSKYSCGISSSFEENLSKLKCLMNKVTSEDVNLDTKLLQPVQDTVEDRHAPVTYIEVLDDPSLTIGIFVLKQGARLPLHDHPLMYGILKVIHGAVHVQSYSIIKDSDQKANEDTVIGSSTNEVLPSDINLTEETLLRQVSLLARKEPSFVLSATDDACTLSPLTGNIHEIHSVDGPAAFLDVLSPPYETDIPGIGPRPCRYFKELDEDVEKVNQDKRPVMRLLRIPSPSDYWSRSAPYQGP